ncbi:unnamed protein product [Rotaria sp. Silwood2]|nr:unnamed protein product [Rotaria sp. Silwood2]
MRIEEGTWFIHMSASNEGQSIKEKYITDSHRQIEDMNIEILFGRLMCDMGLWNQSQHFFEYLLNKSNNNSKDLAMIEWSLGKLLQWKGEWSQARKYYDHVYDRIIKDKPTRIKYAAHVLFDIGEILYVEGKHNEALDYYERAVALRNENYLSSNINRSLPMTHHGNSVSSHIRASFRPVLLTLSEFFQSRFQSFRSKKLQEIPHRILSKYNTADKTKHVDEKSIERRLLEICRNIKEEGQVTNE